MRHSLWSRVIALLVIEALFASSFVSAQGMQQPQTRPRRAQATSQPDLPSPSAPDETETARLSAEPLIRIGLATAARSVTISTTGQLLNATEGTLAPVPLATARVRLEPRLLAPQPAAVESQSYRVEITGAATRPDAERASLEIRELTGSESEIAYESATNTWRIRVGPEQPAEKAEELRARLEDAGFASARVIEAQNVQTSNADSLRAASQHPASPAGKNRASIPSQIAPTSNSNNVRMISRASVPTREVVAYASGRSLLFSSRAPVRFASVDEQQTPVRFNEKPYRGQLEVFTNPNGTLTVVNVLSLEDYVRGVVPNELSPGGYPALEALKAQAIAARTYAFRNRGQFASQGFDLLPTTRSQVYGGLSTEHPLSTRAVLETRGIIATYQGEPINALYTSTCGGRTEDAAHIFIEDVPYLHGRECAPEGRAALLPFIIKSSREPAEIREEQNVALARDAALLSVHSFNLPSTRLTDAWLSAPASISEVRSWLATASRLARQPAPPVPDEATRPVAFASALAAAIYGESRADTLLDDADVEYLLSFRDAGDIPAPYRADIALLLRDGHLSLYADGSLRPREPLSRARALHALARILESRGALQLQRATTKPAASGALILRSSKGQDQPLVVSSEAFLFRAFGDNVPHQTRTLALVGGEPAVFHVNASGQVDYLEVRPAPNGAASDRFSPFANWTSEMTLSEAQSRLARYARGIGSLADLRVAGRGTSRRVTDLEIIGTTGATHLRGGRIRSALGLREQLFVIDKKYDSAGRVAGFVFTGRGWGHGVGMCQVGAYGLARAGWTYDKILKNYYTGIELTKLY